MYATLDPLFLLGIIAFILALVLTPLLRNVFRHYGLVDQQDQGRKIHKTPVPRVGGIAIAFAYLGAFLLIPKPEGSLLARNMLFVWHLLPAAALIFGVGVIDDLFGLKPWQKLAGQFAGASLAYFAGIKILLFGGATAEWWSYPVTVFWLLLCSNAFNLVDGMDGLAGGIGLLSTLTIFVASVMHGNSALALATLPLAACLLGFLCYNFNPATIFLGDSGSLLIGFLLGCFGIVWGQKSASLLGLTAPVMALSIPLFDTLLCIVRRSLKKQPIFSADRGHIHHKLLDRGLTPRHAVLVLYLVASLVACISLLQSTVHDDRIRGLIVVLFCAVAWVAVRLLGYAEFTIAGRLVFGGEFHRNLVVRLELHSFEREISTARSAEDCWLLLKATAGKCGFVCNRMVVSRDLEFADSTATHGNVQQIDRASWSVRVPILNKGFVELDRPLDSITSAGLVGPLVGAIRHCLAPKLIELLLLHPESNSRKLEIVA